MINAHDQRERAVTRLDQSVWYTMSTKERERWSGFSDEVKASILKASSSSKPPGRKFEARPPGRFPPRHNSNDRTTRKVNLHEISAFDYLQGTSTLAIEEDTDNGLDRGKDDIVNVISPDWSEDKNPLLAYVTKRAPVPQTGSTSGPTSSPGDLRNVLSTTKK
jgi:hypothetical protein